MKELGDESSGIRSCKNTQAMERTWAFTLCDKGIVYRI